MQYTIRLMADYQCYPLWKVGSEPGNLNPEDLPLTRDLKASLLAWANDFDQTLNEEYPPDSGFRTASQEEAFEVEGKKLWRALQEQLGQTHKVLYYSIRDKLLHE